MKIIQNTEVRNQKVLAWLKEYLPTGYYAKLHIPRTIHENNDLIEIYKDEIIDVKKLFRKPYKEKKPICYACLYTNGEDIYCKSKELLPILKLLGETFDFMELNDWTDS